MISLSEFMQLTTPEERASAFYNLAAEDQQKLPDEITDAIHKFSGNGHATPKCNGHAEVVIRTYDDWFLAGRPALSYEQWSGLPSEEKHQFCVEEIRDLAENPTTDWTGEQHHQAERYIIDYEREALTKDWSAPVPAEKFINGSAILGRQLPPVVLPLDVPDYDWPDPATIPPRAWLHDKHYMRQVVTATASPGGYGKTSKSLYDAIDMTAKGLNVWYISGEDPKKEIDLRIAAHCQHHKIDHAKLSGALTVVDAESYPIVFGTEKNQALIFDEPQLAALEATIKLKKIDIVIFDPLISFFVGCETNKILHQVVKRLAKICIAQNCNIELDHHTRKVAPGQEITTDDVRGGGSLVNATRSCRVLNRMTSTEAETARIPKKDHTLYLRIDNGKRNAAPPSDAKWMRLVSVDLPNGDNVQAVEPWIFPKPFGEVGQDDQDYFRSLVREGNYRVDARSPQWLGLELAAKYDRDPNQR